MSPACALPIALPIAPARQPRALGELRATGKAARKIALTSRPGPARQPDPIHLPTPTWRVAAVYPD